MSNQKISAMSLLSGAGVDTAADVIPIVDVSVTDDSQRNKKILVGQLLSLAVPPVIPTARILFSDGSTYVSDANLTWDATNGLLVQKNISAPILAATSFNEGLGAGVTITAGKIANVVIGHGASAAGSTSVVVGETASIGVHGSSSVVIGRNASNDGTACIGIGANGVIGNFTYVTAIGDSHSNSHNATVLLGQGMTSVADNELVFGNRGISVPSSPSLRLKGSVLPFTFPLTQETLFRIGTAWIDSTDSTRKARTQFYVYDTGEREFMRADSNGTATPLVTFFGDIQWGVANVALGGGAVPTLGTIGGAGPAAAAQRGWMKIIETDGTASFIPTWR